MRQIPEYRWHRRCDLGRNLTGTNHGQTRLYNRRVVLEAIRVFGPVSRAEIGRRTSLMFQTVSNIVSEFREQQIVHTVGRSKATRGQPAVLVALNENAAFTYGLHLDRNQIRGLLVDLAGNVRAEEVRWVDLPKTGETLALLEQITDRLREDSGILKDEVIGAGLALPGPVDDETQRMAASRHPEWRGVEITDMLGEMLGVPVMVERDSQAAALGERLHGEGRAVEDFFYIYFGIGLGGGLILGGQPYRGRHGYAGEIGHYPAVRDGRTCFCGGRGCLETYCSLGAMLIDCDIDVRDETIPAHVSDLFEAGNTDLLAWLDQAANHMAPALLTLENLLDVEIIFFGGQLPKPLVEALINRLEPMLAGMRMTGKKTHPALQRTTTGENAAALGAAVMPVFEILAPDPNLLLRRPGKTRATSGRMAALQN